MRDSNSSFGESLACLKLASSNPLILWASKYFGNVDYDSNRLLLKFVGTNRYFLKNFVSWVYLIQEFFKSLK